MGVLDKFLNAMKLNDEDYDDYDDDFYDEYGTALRGEHALSLGGRAG